MHFFTASLETIRARQVAAIAWAALLVPVLAIAAESGRDVKVEVRADGLPKKVTFKAKDLFKHAEYLASEECDGRLAGSPGQAKAREYIIKQLKSAGFDDVQRLEFQFLADVKLGKDGMLRAAFPELKPENAKNAEWYRPPQAHTGGLEAAYQINEDFKPLRISKASKVESAPVVFAGYGISAPDKGYDDYAGLDVKGKVVLVLRTEPESPTGRRVGDPEPAPGSQPNPHRGLSFYSDFFYKASTARDKGAAAIVIVNGMRGMSNSERATLDNFDRGAGGRTDCGIPFIQVFPEVADDWLRAAKKDLASLQKAIDEKTAPQSFTVDGVKVGMNVDVVRDYATDENLAVVIPGADPVLKNEIVVIGAHYDHLGRGNEFSLADKADMGKIHGGADDNASGVASVLEIAEAVRKNREALKRTVWIMFFGAEELGTLGSIHFVKQPPPGFDIKNVSAMLNLDMVGRSREKKVMIYGAATGTGFDQVIKKANTFKLDIKTTADGFGGSDQTAFVNAGVPVMFFFTGSHTDYHKPSDTVDKLNVGDQAAITALVYSVAADLINAGDRPKFVKIDAPKMSGGMGGVGLGTLPDYAYEGKGLRLSGVRGGSPADKAGLKAGDVLLKLGDFKIENIYDYMNALKQSLAGVETTAVIKRDDKELNIKVTPEKR